jgi:hypothetical protein
MAKLIHLVAVTASVLVALGFVLFAIDELDRGSKAQQEKLADRLSEPAPEAAEERVRERKHDSVRELVDDANDVLLTPFKGVVDSDDPWVSRGIPTLLALLIYGVGLAMLANYLPQARTPTKDWRSA